MAAFSRSTAHNYTATVNLS